MIPNFVTLEFMISKSMLKTLKISNDFL